MLGVMAELIAWRGPPPMNSNVIAFESRSARGRPPGSALGTPNPRLTSKPNQTGGDGTAVALTVERYGVLLLLLNHRLVAFQTILNGSPPPAVCFILSFLNVYFECVYSNSDLLK